MTDQPTDETIVMTAAKPGPKVTLEAPNKKEPKEPAPAEDLPPEFDLSTREGRLAAKKAEHAAANAKAAK